MRVYVVFVIVFVLVLNLILLLHAYAYVYVRVYVHLYRCSVWVCVCVFASIRSFITYCYVQEAFHCLYKHRRVDIVAHLCIHAHVHLHGLRGLLTLVFMLEG